MREFNLQAPQIVRAINYDLKDVKDRFIKEQQVTQKLADELEIELKRFLILCSISKAPYGMRGPVDELWHTFVIFTKQYFSFCYNLCGQYIHHTPHTPNKTKEQIAKEESEYEAFLLDYELCFNAKPPVHIWPEPVKVLAEQGCYGGCSNGDNDCTGGSDNGGGWGVLQNSV